jgi:hypothetical protein
MCDRDSLDGVASDSHVRDQGNVLDQKPLRPALHDNPASVLQHFATVLDAVMICFLAFTVGLREPLTRRARHNSVDPIRDTVKLTDVAASDLVRRLNDAKAVRSECTVKKSDAREQR